MAEASRSDIAATSGQLTVELVSAATVDGWDDLILADTPDLPAQDFYLSSGLLHAVEMFSDVPSEHVLIWDGPNLAGALVTRRVDDTVTDMRLRLDGDLPDALPARLVGGFYDGRTGPLLNPALDAHARTDVVDRLFAEAETLARTSGERSVVCRSVDAADAALRAHLAGRGYTESAGRNHMVLTVSPGGFDGYVDSFPSRYRNMIRREMRKMRDAGITFAVEPITAELINEAAPLHVNLQSKHDFDDDVAHASSRLSLVRRAFKQSAYAVTARTDHLVGFMELIVHKGNAWGRQAGFDYDAQGALPIYFGVVFYAVMDFASEHGIRVLDYTLSTEEAKISRGCIARPTVRLVKMIDS